MWDLDTQDYQQNIRLGNRGLPAKYGTWQPRTICKIYDLATEDYQRHIGPGNSGLSAKYGT